MHPTHPLPTGLLSNRSTAITPAGLLRAGDIDRMQAPALSKHGAHARRAMYCVHSTVSQDVVSRATRANVKPRLHFTLSIDAGGYTRMFK